jgi:hypothetical protein
MCRIAWLNFTPEVSQSKRAETVALLLKNSWDLGNHDGVGLVTFDGEAGEHAATARSLTLVGLVLPKVIRANVLVHARHATCPVTLANTHPISGGGCHLVHNGIASLEGNKKRRKHITQMLHTTNDSEYILKAYLTNERDMHSALSNDVGGWANVLLWDERKRNLSVFADGEAFLMFRQKGVFVLAQELRQVAGCFTSGLGHPMEYGKLEADRVYTMAVNGPKADVVKFIKKSLIDAPSLTLNAGTVMTPTSYLPFGPNTPHIYSGGTQDTMGTVYQRHPEYWDRTTDPKASGDPKPTQHTDETGRVWVRAPHGEFVRDPTYDRLFRDEKKDIDETEDLWPRRYNDVDENGLTAAGRKVVTDFQNDKKLADREGWDPSDPDPRIGSDDRPFSEEELNRIESAMYADGARDAPVTDDLDEPPYFDDKPKQQTSIVLSSEHTSV